MHRALCRNRRKSGLPDLGRFCARQVPGDLARAGSAAPRLPWPGLAGNCLSYFRSLG